MTTAHWAAGLKTRPTLTVALALFLATSFIALSGGTGATLSAQQHGSATYKDIYDGWKWWHVYCYRCHGVDALGTPNAPNLTDPNEKLTAAQFLKIVREGRADKGMQAWDKLLDDKQIGQIHLYVRARTDKVLPPGRPDEVGPNHGPWAPPAGWPKR